MAREDHPVYRKDRQRPLRGEEDRMDTLVRTWPRKVVISTGFGAGLSTWWYLGDEGFDIIEHPVTIAAVEDGSTWEQFQERLIAAGFDREMVEDLYEGGWEGARVVTVHGPYIINEYDGAETVEERDSIAWRM